jgi:hypothetical protein
MSLEDHPIWLLEGIQEGAPNLYDGNAPVSKLLF